jgi:MFS family permease
MPKLEALGQGLVTKQPEESTAARCGLGWYTSAMVSIVLSSFMAGLGAGSWAAGSLVRKFGRSFSFLYLANVLGAVAGTLVPLILVEIWRFNRTLQVGMLLNVAICGAALGLAGNGARQSERQAGRAKHDEQLDQESATASCGCSSPPALPAWGWRSSGRGNTPSLWERSSIPSPSSWVLTSRRRFLDRRSTASGVAVTKARDLWFGRLSGMSKVW